MFAFRRLSFFFSATPTAKELYHEGATLRVIGRQLPPSTPPPLGGLQPTVSCQSCQPQAWVPKALDVPRAPKAPEGNFVHFAPQYYPSTQP